MFLYFNLTSTGELQFTYTHTYYCFFMNRRDVVGAAFATCQIFLPEPFKFGISRLPSVSSCYFCQHKLGIIKLSSQPLSHLTITYWLIMPSCVYNSCSNHSFLIYVYSNIRVCIRLIRDNRLISARAISYLLNLPGFNFFQIRKPN